MAPLNIAREALASSAVPVPGTTDQWALYAFGGRDGAALSSVEYSTVTIAADGSYTYTPNTDFNGTDQFTYRIFRRFKYLPGQ